MSEYRERFREVEREGWWTLPRALVAGFVFLVVLYGVGFLTTGGDLAIYRFWAPKRANAERQVFINTNSYIQGKTDYLSRLRLEYQTSKDPDQKAALRTLIITEASNVDNDKLPPDLAAFIQTLKED
jgi:hypothetical protein